MADCLVVMQGRQIPEVLDAYEKLPISRAYFTGYCEKQLERKISIFIERSHYDNYIITSDDQIVKPEHLALVQAGLKDHPVVTGYCTLPDDSTRVNLCKYPLEDLVPKRSSYSWMNLADVDDYPDPFVPTTFAGFFLTGMSKKLWLRFPFRCYGAMPRSFVTPWLIRHLHDYGTVSQSIKGFSSDYHLSRRLAKAEVPIVAAKGALIEHLGGGSWGKRIPLIVGKVNPHMRFVPYV